MKRFRRSKTKASFPQKSPDPSGREPCNDVYTLPKFDDVNDATSDDVGTNDGGRQVNLKTTVTKVADNCRNDAIKKHYKNDAKRSANFDKREVDIPLSSPILNNPLNVPNGVQHVQTTDSSTRMVQGDLNAAFLAVASTGPVAGTGTARRYLGAVATNEEAIPLQSSSSGSWHLSESSESDESVSAAEVAAEAADMIALTVQALTKSPVRQTIIPPQSVLEDCGEDRNDNEQQKIVKWHLRSDKKRANKSGSSNHLTLSNTASDSPEEVDPSSNNIEEESRQQTEHTERNIQTRDFPDQNSCNFDEAQNFSDPNVTKISSENKDTQCSSKDDLLDKGPEIKTLINKFESLPGVKKERPHSPSPSNSSSSSIPSFFWRSQPPRDKSLLDSPNNSGDGENSETGDLFCQSSTPVQRMSSSSIAEDNSIEAQNGTENKDISN